MDPISLGCAVADARGVDLVMLGASALGHGAVAGTMGAALLLVGVAARRPGLRTLGVTALLAVAASGILANVVKLLVESPRPGPWRWSYGFPSGHTTTAFAFAGVLAQAFPGAGPAAFSLALLTGVARLYLQVHFTIDVAGGAALGAAVGLAIARWRLGPRPRPGPRPWHWSLPAALAIATLPFFVAYERTLAEQRAPGQAARELPAADSARMAFGTPQARGALLSGWSADERWDGTVPFVWAEGVEARVRLPIPPAGGQDLRLRLRPFVPHRGLSCQRVEVSINGVPAGRLLLERGWHGYDVRLPLTLARADATEIGFRFSYAAGTDGPSAARRLSAGLAAAELRGP